jgi:glycosidase
MSRNNPARALPRLTSLALVALLAACGGGGGSSGGTTQPGNSTVQISSVAGSTESRLACNKGTTNAQCGLRIYQIMTEAFIQGSASDGYGTGYGTSHHKGDLTGITESLDYIKSTGANAIWVTPVFSSIAIPGQDPTSTGKLDATGYYASDYFNIDPKFGTLAQAQTLVSEAHKRGIYVFFDGVFGHHKSNIVTSPTGKLPKTTATCVGTSGTYSAGIYQLCDDYSDPATLAFFQEVASYWINTLGIDGWRLDQAYQVPTSAWQALRSTIETTSASVTYTDANGATVHPLGYMVAEVWSDENTIAKDAYGTVASPVLGSAFDFPGRYRLVQTLAVEESGNGKKPATTLDEVFSTHNAYPDQAMPNLMIGNHDLVRFGDLIQRGGLANPDQTDYWNRHKAAFAFLAAYSGPITIYYGDETGQEVPNFAAQVSSSTCAALGLCDDHVSRTSGVVEGVPTTVGATPTVLTSQQSDLKSYVATLMALRDTHPSLAVGSRTHVYSDSTLYLDRKEAGADHVLFVLNTGGSNATLAVATSVVNSANGLTDLVSGATISAASNQYSFTVPARSARFLQY